MAGSETTEGPVRAEMWESGGRWYARVLDAPVYLEVTGPSRERCLEELRAATGDDRPLEVEVTPSIVGVAEAAEIMGWDKRRVVTYLDRGSFPDPLTTLASGRIWRREDIERFAAAWRARYEARKAARDGGDASEDVDLDLDRILEGLRPQGTGTTAGGVAAVSEPAEAATGGAPGATSRAGEAPDVEERRLILIRHGRPDRASADSFETRLGVHWDPSLDEVGREQAELLAKRLLLRTLPKAVYSSRLARARQTARVYADLAKVPVVEREDLAEWYAGAWEGKTFEEIFSEHPEAADRYRNQDPAWHLAPGAESAADFQARAVAILEEIVATHPAGDIFVFAHAGIINAYVAHIMGMDRQELFFLPEHTSLNTIILRGDERRTWFLSDASHLTDPGWFQGGADPDDDA